MAIAKCRHAGGLCFRRWRTTVPVVWIAGARSVPSWLDETAVEIRRDGPQCPDRRAVFMRDASA